LKVTPTNEMLSEVEMIVILGSAGVVGPSADANIAGNAATSIMITKNIAKILFFMFDFSFDNLIFFIFWFSEFI